MATRPTLPPHLRPNTPPRARRLLCPWGAGCTGRRCNAVHPSRPATSTTDARLVTR